MGTTGPTAGTRGQCSRSIRRHRLCSHGGPTGGVSLEPVRICSAKFVSGQACLARLALGFQGGMRDGLRAQGGRRFLSSAPAPADAVLSIGLPAEAFPSIAANCGGRVGAGRSSGFIRGLKRSMKSAIRNATAFGSPSLGRRWRSFWNAETFSRVLRACVVRTARTNSSWRIPVGGAVSVPVAIRNGPCRRRCG